MQVKAKIRITNDVEVEKKAGVCLLKAGTIHDLDLDQAEKLIGSGHAVLSKFDRIAWGTFIQGIVTGWVPGPAGFTPEWIRDCRPDLWSAYKTAFREIDKAFCFTDTEAFVYAVHRARTTWKAAILAWEKGETK